MNKIVLIGFGEDQSVVGDHAMNIALRMFCGDYFGGFDLVFFSRDRIRDVFGLKLGCSDKIFFVGCGDFGDLSVFHVWRRRVVSWFKDVPCFQFSCSLNYSSREVLYEDVCYWGYCKNFVLMLRGGRGLEVFRVGLGDRVFSFPDMVFYLVPEFWGGSRSGILYCFRNDFESMFGFDCPQFFKRRPFRRGVEFLGGLWRMNRILGYFGGDFCSLDWFDDLMVQDFRGKDEVAIVMGVLKDFSRFELVYTDRFHGWVFSFLAGTPFVPFDGRIKKACDFLGVNDMRIYTDWLVSEVINRC